MTTLAAIDCGTHSTRLLIERDNEPVLRLVELTKVGEGLKPKGPLQPAAMQRVFDAVTAYKQQIDAHNVDRLRVTATSAARDATNGAEFMARLGELTGVECEILSGEEEGLLTFAGAITGCLLYTSPSPRDRQKSRMPSSA